MILRRFPGLLPRIQPLYSVLRGLATQVTVEPYCLLQIKTSSPISIRPFDLLANPAGNQVKATFTKNQTSLDIQLKDEDGQQVVLINEKLTEFIGQDEILLEVPVQVDLAVEGGETVSVSDIESDSIDVLSLAGIATKNIKSQEIKLVSGGRIHCEGTLLAKSLKVQAQQDGEIHLEKVLGDAMIVQSDTGSISINSCYSQSSKISTNTGDLNLKSIHRNCEISVEEEANLTMTGFNGNLLVTVNGGYVDLQISELHGESVILANNGADVEMKLAEEVTNSTYVHAQVDPEKIHLDDNLEPVRGSKENGATTLNLSGCPNKLFIQTDGRLRMKQQSWTESMFGPGAPEF